jgi:3-hydroxyisobutyrate dehydrogenase-like beta-hydroxyacid dehydrogenase
MKIGFIGLGHMGSGMAANLLKAGHVVSVYNRTTAKIEPLVSLGAEAAKAWPMSAKMMPSSQCWQMTMR